MPNSARLPSKEENVSLRDAKAKLSSLTKLAKAGTRVVITNHGTPIADLVQHGTGVATARTFKRPGPLPKPIQLKGKGPSASDYVLMDRVG
ncbi:MAG TPA: type II toxin-antitoxin system prevent-host-death family antitoxin [Polyangia bacterium]